MEVRIHRDVQFKVCVGIYYLHRCRLTFIGPFFHVFVRFIHQPVAVHRRVRMILIDFSVSVKRNQRMFTHTFAVGEHSADGPLPSLI